MNQYPENDKLRLFKSLFKGREDVFTHPKQKTGQKRPQGVFDS